MWCTRCGEAYQAEETTCPTCGIPLAQETPEIAGAAAAADPPPTTAYLGEFPGFQCELVLTILEDHGIYAYAKNPHGESDHSQYGRMLSVEGAILVDATKLEDAKRAIARELPLHLASIERAMNAMESDDDA